MRSGGDRQKKNSLIYSHSIIYGHRDAGVYWVPSESESRLHNNRRKTTGNSEVVEPSGQVCVQGRKKRKNKRD